MSKQPLKIVLTASLVICMLMAMISTASGEQAGLDDSTQQSQESARQSADIEALVAHQKELPPESVVSRGTVGGAVDPGVDRSGSVLVLLDATDEFYDKSQPGDTFQREIVAAAAVDSAGQFEVRLDSGNPILRSSGDRTNLRLIYTSHDGRFIGQARATAEPDGRSSWRDVDELEITVLDRESEEVIRAQQPGESNELDEDFASLVKDPGPDEEFQLCPGTVTHRATDTTPETVGVVGTNTLHVSYDFAFNNGGSSQIGWSYALKYASGPIWVSGSGSYSETTSYNTSSTWPLSNSYGTYSYRVQIEVKLYEIDCTPNWCTQGSVPYTCADTVYEVIPVGFTGGTYNPVKWSTTAFPTWCVPFAAGGTILKENSTATTWTNGTKTGWIDWPVPGLSGEIHATAHTGYTNSARVYLKNTNTTQQKYLCGNSGYPANSPGYIMGDWKDR
ncbi:MAG: hypothetical protein AAGG01_03035 [Planctomycetota bacterium]